MGNQVFLYDDESVVYKPFPELRCDDSKNQPFKPLRDGFDENPRYRGAHRRALNMLVVAVPKLEIVRQAMFKHFNGWLIDIKTIQEVNNRLTRKFQWCACQMRTTSNETMHSSGDMLACLLLSRNCGELEMLYPYPAVSGLRWPNMHFIEAWKTTPTCVTQCTIIDLCYKAL